MKNILSKVLGVTPFYVPCSGATRDEYYCVRTTIHGCLGGYSRYKRKVDAVDGTQCTSGTFVECGCPV